MDQKLIERLVSFRHQLHQYPEIGFQEFQTKDRIKKILVQFGVEPNQMFETQPTCLHVDLYGKGAPSGKPRCIGFRADMDALTMIQTNEGLQYISKNHGKAHMCGHDGHMACLTAFVPLFLKKLDQIPSDRRVRLIYQPSQEGPGSGADQMVKNGCIDEVDQVYGFHQWPTAPLGQLWCKQGPVMSQPTILQIKIIGTSGHGSQPQKLKQSTRAGVRFYQRAMDYLDALKIQKKDAFVCTLPVFRSGQRFNVISQCCTIEGTIRSFEKGLNLIIIAQLKQFLEDLVKQGFKYEFKHQQYFPMNVNTKQEAENVLRVGKKVFGEQNANQGKLPFRASEDFSFFTQKKPGAYFFLSTAQGQNSPMVHCSNFNFNDKLIPKAAQFWLELAIDRLK